MLKKAKIAFSFHIFSKILRNEFWEMKIHIHYWSIPIWKFISLLEYKSIPISAIQFRMQHNNKYLSLKLNSVLQANELPFIKNGSSASFTQSSIRFLVYLSKNWFLAVLYIIIIYLCYLHKIVYQFLQQKVIDLILYTL